MCRTNETGYGQVGAGEYEYGLSRSARTEVVPDPATNCATQSAVTGNEPAAMLRPASCLGPGGVSPVWVSTGTLISRPRFVGEI